MDWQGPYTIPKQSLEEQRRSCEALSLSKVEDKKATCHQLIHLLRMVHLEFGGAKGGAISRRDLIERKGCWLCPPV